MIKRTSLHGVFAPAGAAGILRLGKRGFTLIELLIVMGILSVLIVLVVVAINPGKQFASARNAARSSGVRAILTGVTQLIIDNRGIYTCSAGAIPATPTAIKTGIGGYNLCPCIVPSFVPQLVIDPAVGTGKDCSVYDTGYTISRDPISGRITVGAPSAELNESISLTY